MPTKIEQPYLVICEAQADKNTFFALIKENNLPDVFQFEYPVEDKEANLPGGKYGFWHVLLALPALVGVEDLKGIILLQDTDISSKDALIDLKKQLKQTNGKYRELECVDIISFTVIESDDFLIPSIGGFLTISDKKIPIFFVSVPFGNPGCIETLILSAVARTYPKQKSCLDQYEACCNISGWPKAKKDKMRLASFVAAICKTDPTVSVSSMWREKHGFKSLLTDEESFGEIINFFKNIQTIIPPIQVCSNNSETSDCVSSDCD